MSPINIMKSNIKELSKTQWLHLAQDHPKKLSSKEIYNINFPFKNTDCSLKNPVYVADLKLFYTRYLHVLNWQNTTT